VEVEPLHRHVQDRLPYRLHAPEQIAAILKRDHPQDLAWHVSHGTTYAHIDAHLKGSLKQGLIEALRQQRSTGGASSCGSSSSTGMAKRPLSQASKSSNLQRSLQKGRAGLADESSDAPEHCGQRPSRMKPSGLLTVVIARPPLGSSIAG
jgi:hypothetical protein